MPLSDESQKRTIFREKSLERLSSPERLDQLFLVVKRHDWITVLCIGFLVLIGIVWGCVGKIPVTVDAPAVLMPQDQIVRLQTPAAGTVDSLFVKTGSHVKKGDRILRLDAFETRKELEQARDALERMRRDHRASGGLLFAQSRQDIARIDDKQKSLQTRISQIEELSRIVQSGDTSLKADPSMFDPVSKQTRLLFDLWQKDRAMFASGAVSRETVLKSELDLLGSLSSSDLVELRDQLAKLSVEKQQIQQDMLDSTIADSSSEMLLSDQLARLELKLERQSMVLASCNGNVLEVPLSVGQVVSAGEDAASLQIDNRDSSLVCLAYFNIRDGRRIAKGLDVQVTPDFVQRARFGSIAGHVENVSAFPISRKAIVDRLGSNELAEQLGRDGVVIEATIALVKDSSTSSGYKWTSGKGVSSKLVVGTTSTARAVIERRPPFSYILPFFKNLLGEQ